MTLFYFIMVSTLTAQSLLKLNYLSQIKRFLLNFFSFKDILYGYNYGHSKVPGVLVREDFS